MQRFRFSVKVRKRIIGCLCLLVLIVSFIISPFSSTTVSASASLPINIAYYGWHDATVDTSIINAHPTYLVDNSPAGPWRGNANISKFKSAGIKYFEYLNGGYEGTKAQAIPNDLWSNLNYINAAAAAGAYGVFLDEVSSYPSSTSVYYLQQIADKAHSLGLKVVFNTGVASWSDTLMSYCDYLSSNETWNNASLSASQIKWASRTWLYSYNITDANTAASLTNSAVRQGINSHYACTAYGILPWWLGTYTSQVSVSAPAPVSAPVPVPATATSSGQTMVTFNSNPTGAEVWLDYAYKGVTPLSLTVSSTTHHIGFFKYGFHSNIPLEGNFQVGNSITSFNVDLLNGQIGSNSAINTPSSGSGNTTGTIVGLPLASGGANEYSFSLKITSSSVSGVSAGQLVWCAATTTRFPNLLVSGSTVTGILDKSSGWWIIK